jgi:hypothetical protein
MLVLLMAVQMELQLALVMVCGGWVLIVIIYISRIRDVILLPPHVFKASQQALEFIQN